MEINKLMGLVNAKINDDARRSGVMTLGALSGMLRLLPGDMPIALEGGGHPGAVDSYRGYYERLAFEPTNEPTTVAYVLTVLDEADGETFEGYKGGDYTMGAHTFLHVAHYGDCGPQVVGLRVEADRAVLETKEEEF